VITNTSAGSPSSAKVSGIDGWGDAKEAKKELQDSFNAYQK
jgi:inorganic pyrophosphatase